MLSVTAEKLRSSGRSKRRRPIAGFLLAAPIVGNAMVLFREDTGSRMVTTPVLRVMGSDREIFIQTENSLYRLKVHGRVLYRDKTQRFVPLATREVRLHLESSRVRATSGQSVGG